MNQYLLWLWICVSLFLPILTTEEVNTNFHGAGEIQVEIELDLIEGDALITYEDGSKSKAKVFYSSKKRAVAYKDMDNHRCFTEKLTRHTTLMTVKRIGSEEYYSRLYRFSDIAMEKEKVVKLAGRNILIFCAEYPIILLNEYAPKGSRHGRTHETNGKRTKREEYTMRGNESNISHQEVSRKLLEDLANAELFSNGMENGKGIKRNVEGNGEENQSSKLGQAAAVDYHAHIRNNLHPAAHPIHPIDISSSVMISTGSSHPAWSYTPSASSHYSGQQNGTNSGHEAGSSKSSDSHGIPNLPQMKILTHQNNSLGLLVHGGQSALSHHQGEASFPSSFSNSPAHYPISTTSKHQAGSAYYPPSSASKPQQGYAHYPPSSTSKHQQGVTRYPLSSQHTPVYYPPSSMSKAEHTIHHHSSLQTHNQGLQHYPPSSTTNTHPNLAYIPPSTASKIQPEPVHYPPSSINKFQQPAIHYPPSSTSKSQQPAIHYPPSSTSKSQQNAVNYPPSSTSKSQQNAVNYPPSSTSKSQQNAVNYPPSSTSKTQGGPTYFSPLAANKPNVSPGQYPSSPASNAQVGLQYYPPTPHHKHGHGNATSNNPIVSEVHQSPIAKYPEATHYASPSSGGQVYNNAPAIVRQPAYTPPSSTSKIHFSTSRPQNTSNLLQNGTLYSEMKVNIYAPQFPPSSNSHLYPSHTIQHGTRIGFPAAEYPPSSTSKFNQLPNERQSPPSHLHHSSSHTNNFHSTSDHLGHSQTSSPHTTYIPPSSTNKQHYVPEIASARGNSFESSYPPSSTSKGLYTPEAINVHGSSHHIHTSGMKTHFPHSSQTQTGTAHSQLYPLSSTSNSQYNPSSPSSGQHHLVKTPQSQYSGHFLPPSSTSETQSPIYKHHHPAQHYPPSASSKQPHGTQHQPNIYETRAYYPPSSTSKFYHIPQHNISSYGKQTPPSDHYPPSSTSKLQPIPVGTKNKIGGLVPISGTVTQTPHISPAHYPSPTINKGYPHGLPQPHHSYHGLPSNFHSFHNRSSTSQSAGSEGHSSSAGHHIHQVSSEYPPSSESKLHINSSEGTHAVYKPTEGSKALIPTNHYSPHYNASYASGVHPAHSIPQYPPSQSSSLNQQGLIHTAQFHQTSHPSSYGSKPLVQPCQGPRSLYSITTRTILTPNGIIQRPITMTNNGNSRCSGSMPGAVPHNGRPSPCNTVGADQTLGSQTPCTANINLRKSLRSAIVPGPAVTASRETLQGVRDHEFSRSSGIVAAKGGESETELLEGHAYLNSYHSAPFSKLQTQENATIDENESEIFTEKEKDIEISEGRELENKHEEDIKITQDNDQTNKVEDEEEKMEPEEVVKEGDILEPGDKILGKDGYTISEGFRGRVVSVSGLVEKTRAENQPASKKTNFGKFKYSSELGRYVKDTEEKNFSDCHGEVTFTCTEFLGSNGRAKICKPNPRKKPDGTPC